VEEAEEAEGTENAEDLHGGAEGSLVLWMATDAWARISSPAFLAVNVVAVRRVAH